MFEQRELLIVTQHQKQLAFAAPLQEHLKVSIKVSTKVNTDEFGTFSGEIERVGSPIEVAVRKCKAGLKAHGLDLGVASEGSYGPDPLTGFLPMAQETVVLVDLKNRLEFSETLNSFHTNFQTTLLSDGQALKCFAETVGFPTQGIMLHAMRHGERLVTLKDFNDFKTLDEAFDHLQGLDEATAVRADTDMRAHRNPVRMRLLQELVHRFIATLKRTCPQCATPGFKAVEWVKGLPCEVCRMPTASTLYQVMSCVKCLHQEQVYHPKGVTYEDAAYCDFCNP